MITVQDAIDHGANIDIMSISVPQERVSRRRTYSTERHPTVYRNGQFICQSDDCGATADTLEKLERKPHVVRRKLKAAYTDGWRAVTGTDDVVLYHLTGKTAPIGDARRRQYVLPIWGAINPRSLPQPFSGLRPNDVKANILQLAKLNHS